MTVRPYEPDEDHVTASEWWKGHGFSPVQAALLPKLGMVVEQDRTPVAMAWLYLDNSTGVSMLEWILTNPANKAKVSVVWNPGAAP